VYDYKIGLILFRTNFERSDGEREIGINSIVYFLH